MPKIVIVGAGSVGTTLAHTMQITSVATEIVLIDSNQELAEGQIMDMNRAHGELKGSSPFPFFIF